MTGGLLLEDKKEASLVELTIRKPSPPHKVFLPLQQSPNDAELRPIVRAGMHVVLGQKIAVPVDETGVCLHASLAGTVVAIRDYDHPLLGTCKAVEIQSENVYEKGSLVSTERPGWDALSSDELLQLFRECGLVDMSPDMEPLHWKLREMISSETPVLTLNAANFEPYLTADYLLVTTHAHEIIKGAEILRRAACAKKVIFVLRKDDEEAVEMIRSKIFLSRIQNFEVKTIGKRYPNEINVKGPLGSDPGGAINIATAFAAYEAVVWQKPLIERAVTMGGECLVDTKNLWIRIGATFEDCIQACRGLLRKPRKVLMGGPMKGSAQETLAVPVLKGTQGILTLPDEVTKLENVEPCIRCGECVDACPVGISPVMITLASEKDEFETARDFGVEFCIECGNCTYVCPSKRPMADLIRRVRKFHPPDEISRL